MADDCKVKSYLDDAETTNKIYIAVVMLFLKNQTVKITIDGVIFIGKFTGEVFDVDVANAPALRKYPICGSSLSGFRR
jgi:hypothetical protein